MFFLLLEQRCLRSTYAKVLLSRFSIFFVHTILQPAATRDQQIRDDDTTSIIGQFDGSSLWYLIKLEVERYSFEEIKYKLLEDDHHW